MADLSENDLSADVAAAFDKVSEAPPATSPGDEAPPAAAPDKAAEPPAGERARGEDGKFVAKPKDEAKPAQVQQPSQAQPQTPAAAKVAPPINWKGAGKVQWDKLPQAIQKELADDYAARVKLEADSQQWGSVISPERATAFQAQYGSVQNAVKQLLALSDYATKDGPGFIRWFAQQNRIDLAQLIGQATATDGQQQPSSQVPPEFQREMNELRSTVQQMRQEAENRQKDTITSQIEAFRSDPAHPYFNDVQRAVAGLLMSGEAKDLKDAYEQACWARPDIRQAMIAKQRESELQQQAATVSAARKANGSLNGSPAGSSVPADEPDEDLEGTVRRQVERAFGGRA